MNKTDINFNQIAPIIPNELFKTIFNEIGSIIKKICEENDLDYEKISNDYFNDISKLGIKFGIKKRNKRKLNENEQCMGRKIDGKQCTRGRRDNSEYCKSHANKLPQGRIDEPFVNKCNIKRGRKKKNKVIDYVETHLEVLDGKNYLIDDKNYVYSYNINKPEFLGIKKDGRIVSFPLLPSNSILN